ncbi:hypothetical protein IKE82_01200 [Candidatus Saccharibacteria bacterium]|nr:hypothetical protein [Candidatus Saccharibacteria bacterium]
MNGESLSSNQEQNQNNGIESLAAMPSFTKHMEEMRNGEAETGMSVFEKAQERADQYALDVANLMSQKYNEGLQEGKDLLKLEAEYEQRTLDLQTEYLREQGKNLIKDHDLKMAWDVICAPKDNERYYDRSRQSIENAVTAMVQLEGEPDMKKAVGKISEKLYGRNTSSLLEGGIIDKDELFSIGDKYGSSLVATFAERRKEFADLTGSKPIELKPFDSR